MKDAGYYAIDALRIEAGRRAWGAELGPDETPFEAGLMFAVKLDKGSDFIGREALLRLRDQPLRKKLLTFVLTDPAAYAWGGEAIVIDGQTVGELSSAGWSPKAGACVGLGYVRGDAAQREHAVRRCKSTCGVSPMGDGLGCVAAQGAGRPLTGRGRRCAE